VFFFVLPVMNYICNYAISEYLDLNAVLPLPLVEQFFLTLMLQVSNSSSHSLYMSLGRIALVPLPPASEELVPLPYGRATTRERGRNRSTVRNIYGVLSVFAKA
jgi:hypothetical protein